MAKAAKTADSGVSKFQDALDKLNKAYGVGTVLTLDSKDSGEYDVISTGSIGFDYITLGVGGFVKGKMYELMGWEGTGKSTICGHVVAEAPKEQVSLSVFPDFENEFIPKLKETKEELSLDESASDILLRIATDFQKLAQKLK